MQPVTLAQLLTVLAVFTGIFIVASLVQSELEKRMKVCDRWRQVRRKIEKTAKKRKWPRRTFWS